MATYVFDSPCQLFRQISCIKSNMLLIKRTCKPQEPIFGIYPHLDHPATRRILEPQDKQPIGTLRYCRNKRQIWSVLIGSTLGA